MVARETAGAHDRMRAALAGIGAFQSVPRRPPMATMPTFAARGGARLCDYGGRGPPLVVVPSLVNPPTILDLDEERSLLRWLAREGVRPLLLEWGPAAGRRGLDVSSHVETLLEPLLTEVGEPALLLGYCLGGTMAMMASERVAVRGLATIAAPWHFDGYAPDAAALGAVWAAAEPLADALGVLPMEALQAGFWKLDPARAVEKFIAFSRLDPAGEEAARFVVLEDWANGGEPLPAPAAAELFGWIANPPSRAEPRAGLHFASTSDRIVPQAATPRLGTSIALAAGHVGMVVGSSAREALWKPLAEGLRAF